MTPRPDEAEEPDWSLDQWAHRVIGAALEVHRTLGPGFLEGIYEEALCVELRLRSIPFRRQVPVAIRYKGETVGHNHLDLLVADRLIVELKAIETLAAIHGAQVRSYLKATGRQLGLLINFNVLLLRDGLRRIILTPDSTVPRDGQTP
jgi:GxxExxY protein